MASSSKIKPEPRPVADVRGPVIWIVEPDPASAKAVQTFLDGEGFHILLESQGADLPEKVRQVPSSVVVLGAGLPDASSICHRLKRDESLGYLPVIVIAGDAGLRLEFLEAGADECLVSPVNSRELLIRLRQAVETRRRFDALRRANRRLERDLAEYVQQMEGPQKAARDLNLAKLAIVRNVSHELRTPVLQVKSSVALLKEVVDEETSSTSATLFDMATQAIGRLENTVTSITQLTEYQNLRLEPVALSECVEVAIHKLERSWLSAENYQRIHKICPVHLPLVLADKRGVTQVLQHLLDNALKFSPNRKPVEVRVEPRDDGTIWVGVRDYGIGIPEDQLVHIFETFYQVEASSTRRFSGVGVGLTLAQQIMEQLNSTIHVESTPGKGSTFSFVLPQIALAD